MPAVFHFRHFVATEEIDPQGHANNVAYVEWMQRAAIAHSTAQGWPISRYREQGWSWVVRSHHIEYRRPAFAGDELVLRTWVADMKKFSSKRRFEILRRSGGVLLARAETNWAFVETATGRLIAIPASVAEAFSIEGDVPKRVGDQELGSQENSCAGE